MQNRSWLLVLLAVSGCGVGVLSDPSPAGILEISAPLTLSSPWVEDDAVLSASVTYANPGPGAVTIDELVIEVAPPGGGSVEVFTPTVQRTTLAAGEQLPVTASRAFSALDPIGQWQARPVFRDTEGRRFTGPSTYFEHRRRASTQDAGAEPTQDAGTSPAPDAGTPPAPDAGTPPAPDAGTPPTPDAGTSPTPDAGTPPTRDAGTPPAPDAGTPPTPDAGTPPTPDAGTPPTADAGTPPTPDAGVTPPGVIVEPINPGPSDVTFTVRADTDVHAISPLIYGINQVRSLSTTQRGVGLVRAGGNRWTAYNWENNASNAGTDYNNQSDGYLVSGLANGNAPGEAVRARTAEALANGAAMLVTVPIQGYVAADKLANGDVNQTTNYLQTRFKQSVARKNAPFSLTPDTTDGVVYQDEYVNWLKTQFPAAFAAATPPILVSLDNEPDLWSDTHPRIQPTMVAPDALIAKTIDFAGAVKAVVPNALVTGFVSYGYGGFTTFQDTYSGDYTARFLSQLRQAEVSAGRRLVDVLDLHWYPEAKGDNLRITGTSTTAGSVTARVQAPRSLWDPTYTENSWVASVEGGPIRLIPKMKARIAANYPGTKLGFTEYCYGGGAHISGAIAEADVLGIFGREDVFLANLWELNSPSDFTYAGLRVFTSYDENGAHFGDTSVGASTSDVAGTSVYASIDAANPRRMVIVAINKTGAPITASINLAAYGTYTTANVYRLTSASTTIQAAPAITASTRNGFFYAMPAYSVSVLVPQ